MGLTSVLRVTGTAVILAAGSFYTLEASMAEDISARHPVTHLLSAQLNAPQRNTGKRPVFENGARVKCIIKQFPRLYGRGTVVLTGEALSGGLGYWVKFDNHPHLQFLLARHIARVCAVRPNARPAARKFFRQKR